MRIMISQPMNGLTREQIERARAETVRKLEAEGHEIVDSFVEVPGDAGINAGLYCLGKSFQIMAGCDAVYFMPGWDKARGCSMEFHAAMKYGVKTLFAEGHDPFK
jgi:Asp-tRNA(Asn)/Glu-tRNA(Gln) amidotransferase A subunit family amidase